MTDVEALAQALHVVFGWATKPTDTTAAIVKAFPQRWVLRSLHTDMFTEAFYEGEASGAQEKLERLQSREHVHDEDDCSRMCGTDPSYDQGWEDGIAWLLAEPKP